MKKNLEDKKKKLLDVQNQISRFENHSENFMNEQKLEANLVYLEETNHQKLTELQHQHEAELKDLELQLKKEYEAAEEELTQK